jgi:hypothetical protein
MRRDRAPVLSSRPGDFIRHHFPHALTLHTLFRHW